MTDKLNTHYYDGKLWTGINHDTSLQNLQRQIQKTLSISKDEKFQVFNDLLNFIASNEIAMTFRTARACINTIIKDFELHHMGSGPNHDPINKLNADDLLYLCAQRILSNNDTDFVIIFMLQCEDMRTGMCPQGRTTRLFQTLIMMNDSK